VGRAVCKPARPFPPLPHSNGHLAIDPCSGGELPDVAIACCGHGITESAFVLISPSCAPFTFPADLPAPPIRFAGQEAVDVGVG
jgi:hypothetical protein